MAEDGGRSERDHYAPGRLAADGTLHRTEKSISRCVSIGGKQLVLKCKSTR